MSLISLESLKTTSRISPAKVALFVTRDVMRRARSIASAWTRRNDLAELAQFDDRMLADIGLSRGDVAAAAAEPLWRDPTLRLSVLAVERRASRRDHAKWRRGHVDAPSTAARQVASLSETCAD